MSLFEKIQFEITDSKPIGRILLKLRLLVAKLGSSELEEWVKFESEGYQNNAPLPDYRVLGMAFQGHFSGPFGSGISNAPIPAVLIKQIAGDGWEHYKLRYSAASIDTLTEDKGGLTLDLSNLALLIQGKVYEDMACNQLTGYISRASLVEASNSIRNRLLELTIALQKRLPEITSLELSELQPSPDIASNIYHQTIMGSVTNVSSYGDQAQINLSIRPSNTDDLENELSRIGLSDKDAEELTNLIIKEKPEDGLGKKTRQWLSKKIDSGIDSGIKGGITAMTKVVQEAALQYWGLK